MSLFSNLRKSGEPERQRAVWIYHWPLLRRAGHRNSASAPPLAPKWQRGYDYTLISWLHASGRGEGGEIGRLGWSAATDLCESDGAAARLRVICRLAQFVLIRSRESRQDLCGEREKKNGEFLPISKGKWCWSASKSKEKFGGYMIYKKSTLKLNYLKFKRIMIKFWVFIFFP